MSFLFFGCQQSAERMDLVFFRYEVSDKKFFDEWEYDGMEYEYNIVRRSINDSIFIQYYIYHSTLSRTDTFKITSSTWRYKHKGDFHLFLIRRLSLIEFR